MSEINVTPFVDVMLVLLIVFMVTAPLLTAGVPVDLPEAQAKPLALEKEPITVTDRHRRARFSSRTRRSIIDQLVPKLTALAVNGLDERIYVRGDKDSQLRHDHARHGDDQWRGLQAHRARRAEELRTDSGSMRSGLVVSAVGPRWR